MQSALTSRISSLDNSVLPRLQTNLRKILDGTAARPFQRASCRLLSRLLKNPPLLPILFIGASNGRHDRPLLRIGTSSQVGLK